MKREILKIFKENGFDEYNCPYFKDEEITDIVNELDALFAKRIVGVTLKDRHKTTIDELKKDLKRWNELNDEKLISNEEYVKNIYFIKGKLSMLYSL